ncbi:MAG TPA: hypothetical protein VE093_44760 [Polyangiaceae bacterium]|nr:hypothetical protein [Polyangiaceae bacterium]
MSSMSMIPMGRSQTTLPGLLLMFLATSSSASAQPSEKTAEDYLHEGFRFERENSLSKAAEAYANAWAINKKKKKSDHVNVSNLGNVELDLGRARDAAEHLACAIESWPDAAKKQSMKDLGEVKNRLAEAKKRVGTVRVRAVADDGRLADELDIWAADKLLGDFCPVHVDEVYLAPSSKPQLLTVELSGCEKHMQQVTLQSGESIDVPVTLKCRKDPPWLAIGIEAGVAATGGAVGLGMFLKYKGEDDEANTLWRELYARGGNSACYNGANKADCEELKSADKAARTSLDVTKVAFTVGGIAALAVGGTVLASYIMNSSPPQEVEGRRKSSSALNVSFSFDGRGGGAILTGSF